MTEIIAENGVECMAERKRRWGDRKDGWLIRDKDPLHFGFGLRNVDMRIRLYYEKKTGLAIQSGPEGTEVSFVIPVRTREDIDHDESLSGG